MARWSRPVAVVLAGLLLAACGPSEPEQRRAFIDFLETKVLVEPALRVPTLDDERARTFGDYAEQYRVITRFQKAMNDSVAKPMQEVVARGAPRSIEDLIDRRKDIEAVRSGLAAMRQALDRAKADADAERATLKQPGRLAEVYGAAYDKLVTDPAKAFAEVFPPADDAMASVIALADLIEANRASITLSGSVVDVKDPALSKKLDAAIAEVNGKRDGMTGAVMKIRRIYSGQ